MSCAEKQKLHFSIYFMFKSHKNFVKNNYNVIIKCAFSKCLKIFNTPITAVCIHNTHSLK